MNLCKHCKSELKVGQVDFCCKGCCVAYNTIQDLDLENYYSYYTNLSGKSPPPVGEIDNQIDYISNIHHQEDNSFSITMMVEGLNCGACIWVIENSMKKQQKIKSARVNLSTKRLLLEWTGKKKDIQTYVNVIHNLGYKLIPYDPMTHNQKEENIKEDMLKRLAVAAFGFLQSMMVTIIVWAGHWNLEQMTYTQHIMHIITAFISIPCIIYSIRPFVQSAYYGLKNRIVNMDLSVVTAIVITIVISIAESYKNAEYTHFDSTLMLLFFLLIGRYGDISIRSKIGYQAMKLLISQPKAAYVESNGKLVLTHTSKVKVNDIIIVSIGDKIPLDGIIIEGDTFIDKSIITGETLPVKTSIGDLVYAGSINTAYNIKIRVTKLAKNSLISEMAELIEIASKQKSKFLQISDKVALLYTPFVIVSSVLTFLYWAHSSSHVIALMNAASVLLITCPCALVLAVPAAYITASSKLMENGILLKNPSALEKITQLSTVFLDKTGTLTNGTPSWLNKDDFSKNEISIIKSLTEVSKHPLCKSVQKSLIMEDKNIDISSVQEHTGKGIIGIYKFEKIKLGNRNFVNTSNNNTNDNYMEMWLSIGKNKKRLIFNDELRDGAKELISYLREKYKEISILSGDRNETVEYIAKNLGIKSFHSQLLPNEKHDIIKNTIGLSLMIGDGINDSAAMKLSHCCMSPNTGIDITQCVADIIYTGKLQDIAFTIETARKTHSIVKQNILISLLYNFTTIPFAALGHITPALAAVFMCISSITVIFNALRIKD